MSGVFSRSPGPVAAIRAAIERFERNLHVALPGVVVSYSSSTQTADIRPAVNRLLPSAEDEDIPVSEQLPVVPSVPVMWPRGRGFSCVGTLEPGDPVLLVFCETDFGQWYESGEISDPQYTGRHDLQGAVAIPGLRPKTNPIPVPSDSAALASKVDAFLQALAECTPGPQEPGLSALKTLFAAYVGGAATSGSSILKLGE